MCPLSCLRGSLNLKGKSMKHYSFLCTALLTLAVTQASAQPAQPPSFTELDADGSGYLTADEVAADPFLSDKFSALDSDSDGTLSEDEVKMPQPAAGGGGGMKPPAFSDLDSDGDGELSADEVAGDRFLSEKFTELDRDDSGTLTEDEMRPPRR